MTATFRIRPLLRAEAQPANGCAHRHDYQEVIIISEGGASHRIDWEEHHLTGPHAVLVAQGKQHLFRLLPETRGWVIDFSSGLLPQGPSWLFSHFFALAHVALDERACLARVEVLCGLLEDLQGQGGAAGETEAHLLAALLTLLDQRLRTKALKGQPGRDSDFHILKSFIGVLDSHYRSHKGLAFYAHRLKVNPRRLSAVCKQILGRTPAGLLEERCMAEAKRFLVQSDLTVNQIAASLGYEDQSYFTKVFRKVVKATPGGFRAAWAAGTLPPPGVTP